MADLFRCDKCGRIGRASEKKGRLIVQELGSDGLAHPALYNRKAEVCEGCFTEVCRTMHDPSGKRPTLEESSAIVRESRS